MKREREERKRDINYSELHSVGVHPLGVVVGDRVDDFHAEFLVESDGGLVGGGDKEAHCGGPLGGEKREDEKKRDRERR